LTHTVGCYFSPYHPAITTLCSTHLEFITKGSAIAKVLHVSGTLQWMLSNWIICSWTILKCAILFKYRDLETPELETL